MRMYKVKTLTNLTIEIKRLFRKNITYQCWFTTKLKCIYAASQEEAEQKYKELFFTPLESNEWTKSLLELHQWSVVDKSNNMKFNLPFNYQIKSVDESIFVSFVSNEPIKYDINFVKNNSTYNDFRNWFMNGEKKHN